MGSIFDGIQRPLKERLSFNLQKSNHKYRRICKVPIYNIHYIYFKRKMYFQEREKSYIRKLRNWKLINEMLWTGHLWVDKKHLYTKGMNLIINNLLNFIVLGSQVGYLLSHLKLLKYFKYVIYIYVLFYVFGNCIPNVHK